jgi:nucleotide-binding universal stress UspA family protein
MKTILTPIDFSDASDSVIEASVQLATATQAELVLLHVVTPPIVASEYGLVMENVSEIISAAEKAATKRLQALVEKSSVGNLKVRSLQTVSTPSDSILATAKDEKPSYIVMGSHGHSALYDLLVGSTTHGVLNKAPCPVLIVPRQKD